MDLLFPETGIAEATEPKPSRSWGWQKVLIAAADRLETQGWLKGAYYEGGDDGAIGPVCAVGAMNVVLGRDPDDTEADDNGLFDEAYRRLARFVRPNKFEGMDDDEIDFDEHIQNWNDADERVADDVIKAMREAANVA